jgi:hypothetical protein
MATDDPIRASDADREVVVATLRDAFEVGRVTLEEFNERVSAAYASRTWGDLRKLTIDLPSQPILGSDVPGRRLPPAAGLPPFPSHRVPGAAPGLVREPDPGPEQPPALRRRRPAAILIPLAVWTLLLVHNAGGAGVAFLLIVVFVLISVMSSIGRR